MIVNNGIPALMDVIIWIVCIGTWQSPHLGALRERYPEFSKKFFRFFEIVSYWMFFISTVLYFLYNGVAIKNIFTVVFYFALSIMGIYLIRACSLRVSIIEFALFEKKYLNVIFVNLSLIYLFLFLILTLYGNFYVLNG